MHTVTLFFFFQAEDGIRDVAVTGVQTCALPISFPCAHLYHQDAGFQRKQRPLPRQTVSALKGRDHAVAAAAMAAGLKVTLCPYMPEPSADETWQVDHFATRHERAALGDQMDPTDLENALAVRASSEDARDFDVVWVDPPPHFNAQPTMYPKITDRRAHSVDPDLPALMHLHACEYSATGYFGNERSEEHTSELQSRLHLVCRLLLEKKKKKVRPHTSVSIEHLLSLHTNDSEQPLSTYYTSHINVLHVLSALLRQ